MQYKIKGIILRSQDFFEADKIVTFYTLKKGKIRAIAKGVRRPLAKLSGSLELFGYVDLIIVEGKNLDIITSVEIIKSYKNIRKDLEKTALLYYLAELVDKMIEENEPHPKIFYLFLKILNELDQDKKINFKLLINYFIINFLSDLGYRPEIKNCANCHNELKSQEKYYFSFKLGGSACDRCVKVDSQAMIVNLETLKIIRLFLSSDLDIISKIEPKKIHELSHLVELFLEYIAERQFNSSKFYKQIEKPIK